MPTASQKADKIDRHERYKAKLAARESSQVAAFDAQAQAASKQRLAAFWHKHGARFELWWRAHADRAAATAAAARTARPMHRLDVREVSRCAEAARRRREPRSDALPGHAGRRGRC